MALRVTVAGRVGVEAGGNAVALTGLGRLGRLTLAYLVCERHRPVSRDELADALWGEDLPRSWEQMLRALSAKMRVMLRDAGLDPAQALVTAFGAYQLHLPADAVVDVEDAAANRDAALAAMAAGDAGRSVELAGAAAAVAARQFAPGATGTWVERRQAELRELNLSALEIVARGAAALGRTADAVAAAEEAIALEPFRESAYLALIGAHAKAGNRGEALRAYERCRRVLAEELGVNPSPSTEVAYLELLQDPPPVDDQPVALPFPAPLGSAAGTSLWGREAELDRLAKAFESVATEGRQAVLLGGEAGMGKTALVAAAARQAHAQGARILYGRCDEDLELPYQPFAEALSHFVAHADLRELSDHVDAHGGDLARLAPDLTRRLPDVPPAPSTDPEADRYRLFDTVAALLADACKRAPVVLVLDDLHWATSGTLQLLRHVLRSMSSARLLMLATYRHTEVSDALADMLADLRRESGGMDRLKLEGLDTEAVTAFMESVQGLADEDDDARAQAEAVRVHTGGNPFFVGELLRHLAETGATYRRRGPWSYYASGDEVDVPAGVEEVVARRLRRLSEKANDAVVWASVIGVEFDLQLLERVVEGGDPLDAVEEAIRGHVVVEVSPSHYRFSHALVRDTVYSRLTATRRGRLHRRVGETLEASPGGRGRIDALAHHFAAAATAGCAAKAAEYALAVARQAIDEAAWEEAIAVLDRGIAAQESAGDSEPEHRCDLLLLLAETWTRFFNPARSAAVAGQALELARHVGSPERLGAATYWYVRGTLGTRGPDAQKAADAAVLVAREVYVTLGDDAPSWRARLLAYCPELREGRDRLTTRREALALARESGDINAIGVALSTIGGTLGPLRIREALDVAEEMVSGAPPGAWDGWRNGIGIRCRVRLTLGDRDGFEADVSACDRYGAERRFWFFRWNARYYMATLALLDGRFGEVEALAVAAARTAPEEFDMAREVLGRQRFRIRSEEGDDEQAVSEARALVESFAENPIHLSMLAAAQARIDPGRARGDLERFVDEGPSGPMPPERVPVTLAYRADVAGALGTSCPADPVYRDLLPYQGQVVIGGMGEGCQGAVDRFLGMLAGLAGRWDDAQGHFDSALAIEAGLRSPPLLARTQYWCGRFLMERGDAGAARASLSAALHTAERLSMRGLSRDTQALLAGT